MKHILVLGAGQSSPFLIHYLLEHAEQHNWFVTVGDRDVMMAARRVNQHPLGQAVSADASDAKAMAGLIRKANLVVNILAPAFQYRVAAECVEAGIPMVSASYRDRNVRALHDEAQRKGIIILNEVGLDPGIDHMSAMKVIEEIRRGGGVITSFVSYGSGVAEPDSTANPLRYVITWNPRNVVMSSEFGAQYLADGQIKLVPYGDVFARTWPVEVEGVGVMEAYFNRDSLSYRETYGLGDTQQMVRATLRHTGFAETWCQVVRLGLPNESLRIPNLAERTYAELVEMFLPRSGGGGSLAERVALHLKISPTGRVIDNLRWLGLFSDERVGAPGDTMAEALVALISRKLALPPTERDLVILQHEMKVEYRESSRAPQGAKSTSDHPRREKHISTLLAYGEPGGFTAMSRTVGLPAALAAELILTDALRLTGSQIPTHPDIYTPILAGLEQAGLTFKDKVVPLPSS